MRQITLDFSFVPAIFVTTKWRVWLLVLAVGLAFLAQSNLPASSYTVNWDQSLPTPLWKTLILLDGHFEPYRTGIVMYLLAMALVVVAFASEKAAPFSWHWLAYQPLAPNSKPESESGRTAMSISVSQWRLIINVQGSLKQWTAQWWPWLTLGAAGVLAVAVYTLFKAPEGTSNHGLALWMIALFLVLALAATYDQLQATQQTASKVSALLLLISEALAGASAYFFWMGQGNPGILLWGLGGVGLGVVYILGRPKAEGPAARKTSIPLWIEASVFAAILLVAAYLRLAHITSLAPGVNNDSAEAGRTAMALAMGLRSYSPFISIGWGFETLFIYYVALWAQLVTPVYVATRLAAATIGIATIVVVYLFGRKAGGPPLAWLASSLLAASGIHIVFSGTALRLILQPLLEVAALIFFWQAFERGRFRDFLLGGLLLGLTLHAHNSSRVDFVLFGLFVVYLFVTAVGHRKDFIKRYTVPLGVAAVAAFIGAAPLAGYATGNWVAYASRADFVYVGHRMTEMEARTPGAYWSPLVRNLIVGSMIFNQRGNGNDFFVEDPAFDFPVTFLLPLGLAFTLRHWRKPLPFFLLGWFGMGVATGYLSEPNANRTVAAIVPAYFMIALFLLACIQLAKTTYGNGLKLVTTSVVALTIVSIVLFTFRDYIGPHYRYRWGYAEDATAEGAFVSSLLDSHKYEVYVTDAYYVTDVVRLLTYRPGEDPLLQPYPYHKFDMAQALSGEFPRGKPVAIALGSWREEGWARDALLARYPGSHADPIPSLDTPRNREDPAGYVVIIPPEVLDSKAQMPTGYLAKFYDSSDWHGTVYLSYVDRFFSFTNETPFIPFSASWSGNLQIDQPGDYGFHFIVSNRAQLLIDGTPLIVLDTFDINRANERHDAEAHVSLDSGPHSIQILYNYEGGDRQIQLLWSTPERKDYDWIPMELITPATSDQ